MEMQSKNANPQGYGFREVLLDQKFGGKWVEVDMQIGSGHSTFQGTKFSDFAGGFSYRSSSTSAVLQNRMIYWRTLNDKLELIETSFDYNLHDNQVRFTFQDSPIVGPITIQETEQHVVILVATVTTVNRLIFNHPRVYAEDKYMKNNLPSIFHQLVTPAIVDLKSFNIAEHAHNIPVPTSAASIVLVDTGDCIFALSYESGQSTIIRVDRHDHISTFDLRQSNIFARFLSGFKHSVFSRNAEATADAAVGLSLFSVRTGRGSQSLYLVTLSMNGRLRLWNCSNTATFQEWIVLSDVIIDKEFAVADALNYHLMLRASKEVPFPTFVVGIPKLGFKFYQLRRNVDSSSSTETLVLEETLVVDFRDRDIIDFTLSSEYLFVLVSNPEEETDWQVKSFKIDDTVQPRFNLALLEPLPCQDVEIYPGTMDPKNFYSDLIFNKSPFSSATIYKALGMFANTCSFERSDADWEKTKDFANNVVEYEIRLRIDAAESVSDEEYYEICHQFWLNFYNSCVEYHILTIKPLGIFFDENAKMLGIVKKSRLSFLRPTEFLETLYYFPHCAYSPEDDNAGLDEPEPLMSLLVKFMEILDLIESTMDDVHKKKIEKQLRQQKSTKIMDVCTEISNLLTLSDPHSEYLERRHFIPILESKLRDQFGVNNDALQHTIGLITAWSESNEVLVEALEDPRSVTEYFMASRTGANLTYLVLKQLVQHRFMMARNVMLLLALIKNYFNSVMSADDRPVRIQLTYENSQAGTMAVNNCFLLTQMLERNAEIVQDSIIDNGMKIANLLRANTSDHLIRGKLLDPTPMKLVEQFCDSHFGNWSIRRRTATGNESCVLAFAEAAGRSCWPAESAADHPFEEFLISHCQYTALHDYAILLDTHAPTGRKTTQKFYRGLASLCDGDVMKALTYFISINFTEDSRDFYFTQKILGCPAERIEPLAFYQKVISLFQVFQEYGAVQTLSEAALDACPRQREKVMMASLAFKSALQMKDYLGAFNFILRIPSVDEHDPRVEVREKMASVRTLLRSLLEHCEIETLLALDLRHEFSPGTTARAKVEEILSAQANLSDPLSTDGVYQMLYAYHISRENFYEGATAMYSRAMRIGEKGGDLKALIAQRDSLLDVLTCLSCLPDRGTPLQVLRMGVHPTKPGGPLVPGSYLDQENKFKTYDEILRELQVCITFVKLANSFPASPIRPEDFERKAKEAVDCLTAEHHYDDAIKVATQWNLPYSPILSAVATTCAKLVCDILPASGDPLDYIRHNDTSVLPVTNPSITEIAFRLLENYLKSLEKPFDSTLHQDVTLEILANKIAVPRWLIDSYKKINVSQLIHCYIRYGDWEEATELTTRCIDAALGRVPASEFDPSIHNVDAYEPIPVIPYTVIDMLYHQMELRYEMDSDPLKEKLLTTLQSHIDDYCLRVLETRQERQAYFQPMM